MRAKPGTYNSKDSNHAELVRYLNSEGCLVCSIAGEKGHGLTDLLVGYNNRWALMEVKTEAGRLTNDQKGFRDRCHALGSQERAVNLESFSPASFKRSGFTQLSPLVNQRK